MLEGGVFVMWSDHALLRLPNGTVCNRRDLFSIMQYENPNLNEGTFRWTLYSLLQKKEIFRVDYDAYVREQPQVLPQYRPFYSEKASALLKHLEERYPQLDFVVSESVLLNEFLNHLIAQNTIFIHVEKDVSEYVFDNLRDEYDGNVLYMPTRRDFDRYWTKDSVVVLDLISQSPLSHDRIHEITIEKLLVDIISERNMSAVFSPSELPSLFENAMKSYQVDRRKLNRYAGRRGKAEEIREFMENIDLGSIQ
jgi:hypothetical protein